ncbi:DUF4266 domain-containing protein [Agaribacterium haliotis]|uniref:DUF4266 domain-containing protein n=1 Tax=Agaribacterium haliotis TaxID=2013869 RepID=UPI000BB58CDB|nr:DUF4266 domain-containing protein [Agaribacterium haliotis]
MLCLKRFVLIIAAASSSACSIQPWVQSHERGELADPIMAFERHPASTRYINHVYEARESARGAEGGAGGGCGCN